MNDQVKTYDPIGYDGLSALMEECKLGMGGYVRVENYESLSNRLAQLEQQTQWVSVKTKLPEKRAGVFYLAVNSAGYVDKISRLTKCNQPADVAPITTYSGWLDEHGRTDCTIGDVTHWLPLPAAPTP